MFKITSFKLAILITSLLALFYILWGDNFEILQLIELKTLDSRFNIRGQKSPSKEIAIVAIDDYSIDNLGRWPWPRSYHAELIKSLSMDGAKVIGFDLVLTEADDNYERVKLRELRQYYKSLSLAKESQKATEFGEKLHQVVEECNNDKQFADAMAKYNNVTIGLVFDISQSNNKLNLEINGDRNPPLNIVDNELQNNEDIPPFDLFDGDQKPDENEDRPPFELLDEDQIISQEDEYIPFLEILEDQNSIEKNNIDFFLPQKIKAASLQNVQSNGRDKFKPHIAKNVMLPLNSFYQNARYLGHVNFIPDIDGNLRWEIMLIEYLNRYYPNFGIQLVKEFFNIDNEKIEIELDDDNDIRLGDIIVPIDERGRFLINYYGPEFSFQYFSYSDVLQNLLPSGTFKDKIVIIGGAATGIGDLWATPFSQSLPGVEKHATVISNILKKDFLYRNKNIWFIDIIFILFFGLALGYFLPKLSPIKGAVLSISMFVMVLIVNYFLFAFLNIWVNLIYPAINVLLVSGGVLTFKFFSEERQKRSIKAAFKQYLNPVLVEELAECSDNLQLGGEMKELTVLFSDIRNFTGISEGLSPERLVTIINTYLSAMTKIILDNNGLVDKFIGDAIMAVYGAPLPFEKHPYIACASAFEMIYKLNELRPIWKEMGFPDINIGIGINTGPMVIGNMGSEERFDYTVLGDSVNLASRLEGLNKTYGTNIIISEFTYEQVKEDIIARELDLVRVKGKEKPVKIYELIDIK